MPNHHPTSQSDIRLSPESRSASQASDVPSHGSPDAEFARSTEANSRFSVGIEAKFEKLMFLASEERDKGAALELAVLTGKLGTSDMKLNAAPMLVQFPETLPVVAGWLADERREVRMSAANSIRALRFSEIDDEHADALKAIDSHIIWRSFGKLNSEEPSAGDSQFLEATCMALDGDETSQSLVLLKRLSEHQNPGVHFVARMFLDIRENKAA